MFEMNLGFSEKKYQNSRQAPYSLGRSQAFQGKKFQNSRLTFSVWVEHKLFKGKSSKTQGDCHWIGLNLSFLDEKVPKHRLALSVWVECKLFKGKSSKTGLKHRGCIWRIGRLSCYRPRGHRYSHTYAYAFLESFSLKSLYSAQTYGA